MKFVASGVAATHAGVDAEDEVWESLKEAYGPDATGVAFRRYPVVDEADGRFDRELDVLVLSREHGLVVLEVKGYTIDQIARIEGERWVLSGTSQDAAAPYTQVREQGFRLLSHFTKEPSLMDRRANCVVAMHPVVALPNVTREEWVAKGFDDLPAAPRVITGDELTPAALRDRFDSLPDADSLSTSEYGDARAVLSGGQPISGERFPDAGKGEGATTGTDDEGATGTDGGNATGTDGGASTVANCTDATGVGDGGPSRADLFDELESGLKRLDDAQEEFAMQVPDGPQQVRGIAGSGKSIVLAQKAAQLHARHPEWNVVLTFQTRALYEAAREAVHRYYAYFADDDVDWSRLQVMHAWGGKTSRGLYYDAAQAAGVAPRTFSDAKAAFGDADGGLLANCCEEVLESGQPQERYDAILVDEAQDFEPGFLQLCHAVLKPPKRLVWAYDEAQSLQSLQAPSPTAVFGTDDDGAPVVDLKGQYEGGVRKSIVMRKAYRTPRPVLLTAHGLGMGLLRDAGAVQALTTQRGWESLGYEVERGDFRRHGEPVEVVRPDAHSPHPLRDREAARPFLSVSRAHSRAGEVEHVADAVAADVHEEGLAPEEVLVVPLGDVGDSRDFGDRVADALAKRGVDANRVWKGNVDDFREDGAVTVSRINRAKGNEAASVHVAGVDRVADDDRRADLVTRRNELFVGLTRTQAWASLSGVDHGVFDEVERVREQATGPFPALEFPAPTPDDLDRRLGGEEGAETDGDGDGEDGTGGENATLDDFEWVEQ
ncbi:ATP-binding domain-containing protein [Halorubellus sp. JP-L1]|uniref:NERD domain-containing protein n=1 Tax=Halorubellus sp. JP-L1 TaxID=2715753 RepID=UPI0014075A02|nr:nuclease-related domain-containing DEAD/DEAH box helicase [Halorubellus sp. JP-L1]NHN43095.1 ATP-binding domain-containing protein [Halorubellus sp. JP-L1]